MDEAKGCVHRYGQFENLVPDGCGKFQVVVSKRRHPHIEIGVVDRGMRGGVVGSGGDRGPIVGLGMAPGPSCGGRRCRARGWGGHGWGGQGRGE